MAGSTREMTVAGRGIGIDVGSYSVKVAVVRRQLNRLVLEQVVERPIAREGAGRPAAAVLAEAVASAMDEVRVGRAIVTVGVPTQLATVRNLDVPFDDEERIRQVVKAEVEPHLPFSAEEIVVDFAPTGVGREAPAVEEGAAAPMPTPTNLLITAVQKRVVGELLGAVGSETLDPEVVDVEYMGALSAVLRLAPETIEGGELVVDVGAVKTSVIYAQKGRPLAVRSINFGGDTLTQAIADATGAPFADAERDKPSHPIVAEGEGALSGAAQAINNALLGLRRGLDQTLRFFASPFGEAAYERVVLTGGGASMPGLQAWLAATLGREVRVLDGLGAMRSGVGDEVAVARFATAIGLALRGVGESVALHNFRQEELGYANPLKRLIKYIAPAVALIIAIILAGVAASFISNKTTTEEAERYQAMMRDELRKILGPDAPLVSLEDAQQVVNVRTLELQELAGENPRSVLDVIYELSRVCYGGVLPPDDLELPQDPEKAAEMFLARSKPWEIQISKFQMASGRVDIEGTAASYSAVNQLKLALEKSPLFSDVQVRDSRLDKGRQTLKITMRLEG
ncbi:MAG: pilus assembly protein PilM [Verrucomicrobia bacterium]|nr:pilus assembly protein PilM [Verrucomicrobiota bacterium]